MRIDHHERRTLLESSVCTISCTDPQAKTSSAERRLAVFLRTVRHGRPVEFTFELDSTGAHLVMTDARILDHEVGHGHGPRSSQFTLSPAEKQQLEAVAGRRVVASDGGRRGANQ